MSTAQALQPDSSGAYQVQGREVTMPVVVRDASSGAATYLVDSKVARGLLPDDDLDIVELLPGRALFSVACIDYRDNDLGDYNEVSLALFVRPKGEPTGLPYLGGVIDLMRNRLATYIWWLPVNQSFTRDAGEGIWGFPKTVEQIEFRELGNQIECRLDADGRHVLTMTMPRGGKQTLPEAPMTNYTRIAGAPARISATMGSTGVGFRLGGATLELGDHEVSNVLRALGLPKRPLMSVWMENMHGSFVDPEFL